MLSKFRENFKFIIITVLITLLPVLVGLILWNRLPDQIPTHFNGAGVPDGFSSKPVAVFGLPVFLAAMQFFMPAFTAADPRHKNISNKVFKIILLIIPTLSVLIHILIYAYALGADINISVFASLLVGVMLIVLGNYLPKSRRNYTVGIKIPWTLSDDENWDHTHRFAGVLYMIGGVLMLISCLLPRQFFWPMFIVIMILTTGLPTLYSFLYYMKHGERN